MVEQQNTNTQNVQDSLDQLRKLDLHQMIKRAKPVICKSFDFSELEQYSSMSELLNDMPIEKLAEYAYKYALYVLQGRFPEAEFLISQNAIYAYLYAKYVLKDRFPEAEPLIAQCAVHAYEYALFVLQSRFIEAEPLIARDLSSAYLYEKHFNVSIR